MAIHLAKISPLLLVFGLALPLFAHAATINPPPNNLGLVGYWSFDEGNGSNATDFSGQGHTATLTGGTWVSGKLGNALSFNGTSDKVTGGSFTVGTNMTISAWVYKNTSTAQRSFFSNRGANGKVYFGLYGTQIFLFDNGGSPNSFKSNTGVVSIGKWQHIVVTSDGSTSTFYINGIFATSTTQTRTASTGASFGIGWDPSLLTEFWDGKIDEVRVYSRTLSAAEVSALYQTSAAKFNVLNNNGLVGYWNFNEGGGTTAGDHSGNGTLGTLTGTALPTWTSGKIGQSLTFNGSNQVSLRSMSALTTFTISAWVRLNATPHAYDMIFVTRDTGGGNGIDFRFEGGKLKLYSGGATSLVVTTGTYGPANGWMYVTATRDGAGNAT
ncbi:MAG TPA: LamG domain-containing protein, partial [Candidatus Paceibacterota bacterium]